jgi:hypothetical protein
MGIQAGSALKQLRRTKDDIFTASMYPTNRPEQHRAILSVTSFAEPAFDNLTVLDAFKRVLHVFPHIGVYSVSQRSTGSRSVSVGFWDAH